MSDTIIEAECGGDSIGIVAFSGGKYIAYTETDPHGSRTEWIRVSDGLWAVFAKTVAEWVKANEIKAEKEVKP